ncbi:hypothetical protein [Halalkalicoccus salilacus]
MEPTQCRRNLVVAPHPDVVHRRFVANLVVVHLEGDGQLPVGG